MQSVNRPSFRNGMTAKQGERWYVVQTLARREAGVLLQLQAQRFRAFLPRMTRTVRHARKLRNAPAAVFPGYLFVTLDLQRERWRSINGTYGAAGLIMGAELPLPVPRGVVETLLDYVDESGMCRFDRDLVEGQSVRVMAGPFANAIGRLVRLDGNGRVRVLLDIMGGEVPANLARSALQAV
ncbi:MAG: transcription antiterminator NusG [Methylocystaceae bacterium]|nr:MAG: transcription antiterminator NusG [Methylocystaceae bacterium]